ncbi:MAG: glycoside hydrolase family 9 protein [Bacteroidota bacterium]
MKFGYLLTALLFFIHIGCSSARQVFIRVNQVGYRSSELKTAAVFSNDEVRDLHFNVLDAKNRKKIFSGTLMPRSVKPENFRYFFSADFSGLASAGKYVIEVDGNTSPVFSVGENLYGGVADSLLEFFRVQRCGYTDPLLHGICHPDDISRIIDENGKTITEKFDLTGGWHDAADYIKFLNTTAFVTYTLMFSYEFDPVKFGSDNNRNSVPDILEEAKIGLDWLLRANYKNKSFISQVQDLRDHDQGWRMPEGDQLVNDRVGYLGIGKNTAGMYVAVMSMAARIWRETIKYDQFADYCQSTAEIFFASIDKLNDLDKSGTGEYRDNSYYSKVALGAVELYQTTANPVYLKKAAEMGRKAGSDFWWSWADIGAYAHYKLALYDPQFRDYLRKNLVHFDAIKNKDPFGRGADYVWGSNNASLGAALQVILWKKLTGDNSFDSLLVLQRDYILGRNPWGVSFIYNIGSNPVKRLHSQIAYFTHGRIPGAMAGGPVKRELFEKQKIKLEQNDGAAEFQSSAAVFYDDRNDYLTNEPAISSNATALFVFGYFK